MTTDTSERGLERLICTVLAGDPCEPPAGPTQGEPPGTPGGVGWLPGNHHDYDRDHCVDLTQLATFLRATQPKAAESLGLSEDGPTRRKFLARLRSEIDKRGTIDVLRNGIRHVRQELDLFYETPSAGNEKARVRFGQNRFTVTRQLRYSRRQAGRALDIALFINGIPVFTFELKNTLTKQTVQDAVQQYKADRDPKERLFALGRCIAHFAVDENEVRFCTHLQGKASWFLPFNRGWDDGAGNPPNPNGLKTDYLWRDVLAPASLADVIENYAHVVVSKDEKTGKKERAQIWPRYHQLDVVRRLLADVREAGAGKRYLIQHSAGSGKSNSIAWLVHQLVRVENDGAPAFDSIIVVTDRLLLDSQLHATISQYAQVRSTLGHAGAAADLREMIEGGKKIIVSTVQKFPHLLEAIGNRHRGRRFAIIIDEAHSSQGGRSTAAMSGALSKDGGGDEKRDYEDQINDIMASRRMLSNASYFAFTATPKAKTLEIFGAPDPQPDGYVKHRAFHSYTMKQAIQEGFILDVLEHYTPVKAAYAVAKTIEDDPEFDTTKALKKLRRYVEGHEQAIRLKAEIMVDHFHDQVMGQGKLGGEARAMVVVNGIERAIQYFHAITSHLRARKSRYRAIVAFSGEHEFAGAPVKEASLNGFPSGKIAERIREDPYRILVCADKFQTGYDEPLLHTMYVDKTLSGIKAVQTLSRLNRSHPKKHDAFVLDFLNETKVIELAFADYYRTTILSEETDPDTLNDLQGKLDDAQVYTLEQVDALCRGFLGGADRDQLDLILDACVAAYVGDLDEDAQVTFKGNAKAFVRTYGFLSSITDSCARWERRSIFLNFLIPKLPAPREEDLSRGVLDAIDMDTYALEVKAKTAIELADEDAEIEPAPPGDGSRGPDPKIDALSNIVAQFNEMSQGIEWEDADRVLHMVTETIPTRVAEDTAFRNARLNSDEQNARIELDGALRRVMTSVMSDDTTLFKEFMDNDGFRRQLTETVFRLAFEQAGAP